MILRINLHIIDEGEVHSMFKDFIIDDEKIDEMYKALSRISIHALGLDHHTNPHFEDLENGDVDYHISINDNHLDMIDVITEKTSDNITPVLKRTLH